MRFDDEERPKSISADSAPLQVNGSPLPVITLIRPMESEVEVVRCAAGAHCEYAPPCECCEQQRETCWGWLCCIHAHIDGARYGYHTAWIRDLGEFTRDYLDDPELALKKWFKYNGPEKKTRVETPVVEKDIFEEGE